MSAASTIPVSVIGKTVLIRVITRGYSTPSWFILGTRNEYEFEHYWGNNEDLVLGEQSAGEHILDVTDLGLDPADCLAYLEARDRVEALCEEENAFNLHSDPDGKCLCGMIAEQRAIGDAIGKVVTSAVNTRFDTWTRRRHLVALADSTGMFDPSNYPNTMIKQSWPVATTASEWPVATTASEWLMAP